MRLVNFLSESNIDDALNILKPDMEEEYTKKEVLNNIKVLIKGIKEARKSSDEVHQSTLKDFISKLRKWIKLFEDRFGEEENKVIQKAKDTIEGKEPKVNQIPVSLDTPLPYDAQKKALGIEAPEEEEK